MRLAPSYMFFQFTSACNSRCVTCDLWNKHPAETIPLEHVARLGRFVAPDNIGSVFVTGGEPLLAPTCVEVAKTLNEWKPGVRLISATNGLNPELYLERVRMMQVAGVTIRFAVSVNGLPDLHDESRGTPGSYVQALSTARGLKSLGALASLNILAIPGRTRPQDWSHVMGLARDLDVPCWSSPILRHNPWFGQPDDGATIPPFDCCAGAAAIVVLFNGDITACQEPRPQLVFGNLRDDALDPARVERILDDIKHRRCQPCGCCTTAFTHGHFVS